MHATDAPQNGESHDTETETKSDDESSGAAHECHETVNPDTQEDVLERDRYSCRLCGRVGPTKGGLATLHVHHIERDPDGLDEHDMANLTTLCQSCHSWHHQQATEDDAPVELSDADLRVLLPQDIEILRLLADEGPATTGEITTALTADLSVMAVRERLWVLMGLDNIVDERDEQVLDKDVESGEWGLAEQIVSSTRGRIPDDLQELVQRIEDERVRQALARGCERETVADVLGITRRTTFYKEKRAHAYEFPLAAIDRHGGRSTANDVRDSRRIDADPGHATGADPGGDAGDEQRVTAPAEASGHDEATAGDPAGAEDAPVEQWPMAASDRDDPGGHVTEDEGESETVSADGQRVVRQRLQAAIDALEAVESAL